jgi:hypothetical protein
VPTQEPPTDRVEKITVDIQTMKASSGTDYYVRIMVGRRSLHPYKFRERYQAEFEAETFRWLLGLTPRKPDLMAYGPETHPNNAAA